jgi:hypothetical protein
MGGTDKRASVFDCTVRDLSDTGAQPERELGMSDTGSFNMAGYQFQVGDLVRVQIGISPKEGRTLVSGISKPLDGIYRVICFVPVLVGDEPHYRIRDCFSQVERVVGESALTPAVRLVQPPY